MGLPSVGKMSKSELATAFGELAVKYVSRLKSRLILKSRYVLCRSMHNMLCVLGQMSVLFEKRSLESRMWTAKIRPNGYLLLNYFSVLALFSLHVWLSRLKSSSKKSVQETMYLKEKRACDLRSSTVKDKLDVWYTRRSSDSSLVYSRLKIMTRMCHLVFFLVASF